MQTREGMLEQMETYAVRARTIVPLCDNEAQTKVSLINPYLELLGYDVRDPRHVRLEVRADFHEGREKVDYAVMRAGEPWMVVEAKPATKPLDGGSPTKQIVRYAMATPVRYVALTNGRTWRWFRKGRNGQMLEEAPFLGHDVCEPGQRELRWLSGIHQTRWDGEAVARIADEESMQSQFEGWFEQAKDDPPEKLLGLLLNEIGMRATASMLARAREAWKATVRGRETAMLARARRRLQGEDPVQAGPVEQREETEAAPVRTRSAGRRSHYRIRTGADAPWSYFRNGRAAATAVAGAVARVLGAEALIELWQARTVRVEYADAPAPDRYHETIPGTDWALFANLQSEVQVDRMRRAVEAVDGLEVETEGGERMDGQAREDWPWRPVVE